MSLGHLRCLHQLFIGPAIPLTQPAMLASAAESPVNAHHYTGQSDVFHLAAHLAEKVARNHPFGDGNKRTSLLAADVSLRLNGRSLMTRDEGQSDSLAKAQVHIVTGHWNVDALARHYEKISDPSAGGET